MCLCTQAKSVMNILLLSLKYRYYCSLNVLKVLSFSCNYNDIFNNTKPNSLVLEDVCGNREVNDNTQSAGIIPCRNSSNFVTSLELWDVIPCSKDIYCEIDNLLS